MPRTRDVPFQVRLTAGEYERWREHAARTDRSLSQLLRESVDRRIAEENEPTLEEQLAELGVQFGV
jgi:hypothetical protein